MADQRTLPPEPRPAKRLPRPARLPAPETLELPRAKYLRLEDRAAASDDRRSPRG